MPLLTDEPLIDDSELDDFDWDACLASTNEPQPLTSKGNIMTSYHRLMHTTALCVSAVLFQAASFVLGRAVHHKYRLDRLRDKERARLFGAHHVNDTTGFMTPGTELPQGVPWFRIKDITPLNKWTDADPCSDFDPIHPDYVPYSEK